MRRTSIKPGRGPSLGGMFGGVIGVLFGIFWTVMAFSMTRDSPFPLVGTVFPLFGVVFIAAAIFQIIYNAHNALGENRFSNFDIVPSDEELDPLTPKKGETVFCTKCGTPISEGDRFCRACGSPTDVA